jgi:sigma-B regulation protein RsbQ
MQAQAVARHNATMLGHEGPVVVLAHGFGSDQSAWRFIVPELARDHRVLLFDHVGSGHAQTQGWSRSRYGSLAAYQRDLTELLDALNLTRVNFIGHSISGSIGALMAIDQPERFERLIMLGPNPCFINDGRYIGGFERNDVLDLLSLMAQNLAEGAHFLAPLALGPKGTPALIEEFHRGLSAGDPAIVLRFAEVVFHADIRAQLCQVHVPTWVLQCADDAIAPHHIGDVMVAQLPRAALLRLEATGHCPHLTHPRELAAVLRDCLQSTLPA